jgi:hypothetical protein
VFRRKQIPPHLSDQWSAFIAQAERVENARQALLGCLPVGRVDPAPIPVGLDLLHDELVAVRGEMRRWRVPPVETQWQACVAAIDEALQHIAPARETARRTAELEELLEAVTDVVEPLDVWQDAERTWRSLSTRR